MRGQRCVTVVVKRDIWLSIVPCLMVEVSMGNVIAVVNGGFRQDFAHCKRRRYLLMSMSGQMMAMRIILTVITIIHRMRKLSNVMINRNMEFTTL